MDRGKNLAAALVIATGLTILLAFASREPEPHHPKWATVTKTLASSDWPLVIAARYDPANHFILVDLRPGVTKTVALRLACDSVQPLVDGVDSTAGFALYDAPDRVLAQKDDCALPGVRKSNGAVEDSRW